MGWVVCPECNGNRLVEDESGQVVTCPECGGDGVVWAEDEEDDEDDD